MITEKVIQYLVENQDHATGRLMDFLRIPSVSTDPVYAADIQNAANWISDVCRTLNLTTQQIHGDGHPIVIAGSAPDQVSRADAPRVVFYGHYDVQPPDPLDRWTTPPFEPVIRDGKLFARGANDDKGQLMCFIEAIRAWLHVTGKLPCHVILIIEGEEECGSGHLHRYLEENGKSLQADIAVVSDTCMWNDRTPAITYALRGLLYFDVKLEGPHRDLHSGIYGGTLANPATILCRVLGRLFDEAGRITIPGFYDDVIPLCDTERIQWSSLGFDETNLLGPVGVNQPWGEAGYNTLERKWARPSCDINGLHSGYGGEGAKTIIPSAADAKVSFRLIGDQNPDKIDTAFTQWLESQDVHGLKLSVNRHGRAWPVRIPIDSPWIAAASRAIQHVCGCPPVLIREGATIPVVADLKQLLGLDSLLVGFGLNSDCIHSPDEHFAIERFIFGSQVHSVLLEELSKTEPPQRNCG